MAKTGSFIKLDRGLKANPLWLEKPFSKGQAWVDLLLLAQGVEKEKHYRGQIQMQKPGIVYTSILFLEKRWGWSRNKVYRFFEYLIDQKMISVKGWDRRNISTEHINGTRNGTKNGTTNGTIVTIEKWALYQHIETKDETNDDTKNETPKRNTQTEHTIESNIQRKHIQRKNIPPKSPKGDSTPSEKRKAKSHLLLKRDEGTVDDIPDAYRDMFDNFQDYYDWRNQ